MSGSTPPRPLPNPQSPPRRTSTDQHAVEKENHAPALKPRPLPVPKDVHAPIPASSFYGSAADSSARSQTLTAGSSHTSYQPPKSPPPYQKAKETTPFREPELVEDENPPSLVTADTWGAMESAAWDQTWTSMWDNQPSKKVKIDGRNESEELNWCDEATREKHKRPGPGLLPTLLVQGLHHPEHTLYSIQASAPPLKHPPAPSSTTSSSSSAASSTSPPPAQAVPPPSADEIRTAIPHPNAYYCKEHNGWVLLFWCSSSVLPPTIPSYNFEYPLPDQARRKRTSSCVGDEAQTIDPANRTHHFHKYAGAVDARTLNIPFKRSEWESEVRQKRRNRSITLRMEGESSEAGKAVEKDKEVEGDLLDLYVCCQCSVYCLVSREVIPGVVPLRRVEEFVKDKLENPPVGKTGPIAVVSGWETIITIIENRLWRGESRVLPVGRPKFQAKIGWSTAVARVFESLDFYVQPLQADSEQAVHPPSIDLATPEGRRHRAKLLRAWVEISAWLTLYHKTRPKELTAYHPQVLHVNVESATGMIQTGVGAHVNQIPRGLLPVPLVGYEPLERAWEDLGLTPTSYSPELLAFAYLAQCRCDPASTIIYFSGLYEIVDTMKNRGVSPPEMLEMLIAEERSRHRFTLSEYKEATHLLGFGKDNILGVELEDDIENKFIISAWKEALKRSWSISQGSQLRSDLNDAFKIVADMRGSAKLRTTWEQEKVSLMSPDTAYSTLDVPKDVDETMLITIFNMRVEDQPTQADKMREAMSVIAELTDSSRLRQFLETGRDPGDATSETRLDMPRGLNQLGNTCYLNSLLQYFYTIKELRAAVSPMGGKLTDLEKFTDDDLKRHRVGGRLVTRREVQRSKKFVNQLADLFWNLEYCETQAVTPSLDLAKLALVTSQDEEEDDQSGGSSTDASNDTDATLVEDGPARPTQERSSQSPGREPSSPNSVLGKRIRQSTGVKSQDMEVDSEQPEVDKDGYVLVSKPSSPVEARRASVSASPAKLKKSPPRQSEDVEMKDRSRKSSGDNKAPPLPPRKARGTDDSVMMFGRQHDVSECMDNCMFQIETALLDFHDQEIGSAMSDKTSIIKRLFYGKKRQRLTPLTQADAARQRTSSTHEKEDLFSHLHLNVGDEGFDLYDGLSRYFDDVVDFEGVKKRMEVTIVDLPPLLQIQLQRVQFDRETQQAYKSQAYVKFGETVCMDRFLDSGDPEKRARSRDIQLRLNTCRDRIHKLTQGKHAPFAPSLGSTAEFLTTKPELGADADLVARLNTEKDLLTSQLEQERATAAKLKAELEELWKRDTAAVYDLTSVFIHRGSSPSFGHYFFYSRNLPDNPDQWFKYNDSSVSVVSKDEVFADTTGHTANPYMLVFARRGSELIDTVHRFDMSTIDGVA